MPERKFELKTFGVDYVCDKCGDGTMEQTGTLLPVDPPIRKYRCDKCGNEHLMRNKYPDVCYERKKELDEGKDSKSRETMPCSICGKHMVRFNRVLYAPSQEPWYWWCDCGNTKDSSTRITIEEAWNIEKARVKALWKEVNAEFSGSL